jgi:hypothetical protein
MVSPLLITSLFIFHGSTALVGLRFLIIEVFEITLRHATLGRTPPDE